MVCVFILMIRRPTRSTRTDTLVPYSAHFRAARTVRMIVLRSRLTGGSRPFLTEPAADRQIEERNEENSQRSGGQHSADNTGPNGDSARCAGAGSDEERYNATEDR